ncbi:MAG TPA: lysophospholipid acyltransferase family protein [Burkholderiales bacterium]|nr:lysophospholipid acyltransferase family protein [Burkholderiales bacterium]
MRSLRSFWSYALLWYGLGLLALGSFVWGLFALPLLLVLPRRTGQRVGRIVVSRGFRLYLGALEFARACRFDLRALDALRDAGPIIIAPNHPSLIDAVMLLSRTPQAACVLKAPLIDSVLFGLGARLAGYIRNDNAVDMVRRSVAELRAGGQLLLFPEGTRTTRSPLNPFRGAISLIARQAAVPVQTVFIEADSAFLGKEWPLTRQPQLPLRYRVRLGRRFEAREDLHAFMAELEQYFARELGSRAAPADAPPVDAESRPA